MPSRDDIIYKEFGDADLSRYPFVKCLSARLAAVDLMAEHKLWFKYTSNGGRYWKDGFQCIVSTTDDCLDLKTLREAISASLIAADAGHRVQSQ